MFVRVAVPFNSYPRYSSYNSFTLLLLLASVFSILKKVAQHEVRVSALENRVDALETIAGGSSSPPTALSARRQRQQQTPHWADSGSAQSRSYSLGRQIESDEQPGMQMTASLSLRIKS